MKAIKHCIDIQFRFRFKGDKKIHKWPNKLRMSERREKEREIEREREKKERAEREKESEQEREKERE